MIYSYRAIEIFIIKALTEKCGIIILVFGHVSRTQVGMWFLVGKPLGYCLRLSRNSAFESANILFISPEKPISGFFHFVIFHFYFEQPPYNTISVYYIQLCAIFWNEWMSDNYNFCVCFRNKHCINSLKTIFWTGQKSLIGDGRQRTPIDTPSPQIAQP